MPLADRVKAGPAEIHPGGPCSVGHLLRTLDKSEADALRAMLADPRWPHSHITKALNEEGYHFRGATVARHRHGDCSCKARGIA